MPPFRFDNKKVFLTYSQCPNLTHDELFNFLSVVGNGQPKYLIVARELHGDGGQHFHAVIDFGKRFRSRDVRVFDRGGYHPNISAISTQREYANKVTYTKKDGDFRELGTFEEAESRGHKQQHWIDLIDGSENRDDFMAKAKAVAPRDFVLQNDKFEAFAAKYYNNVATYVSEYTPEDFEYIPTPAKDWVEEVLNQVCSGRLLFYQVMTHF